MNIQACLDHLKTYYIVLEDRIGSNKNFINYSILKVWNIVEIWYKKAMLVSFKLTSAVGYNSYNNSYNS